VLDGVGQNDPHDRLVGIDVGARVGEDENWFDLGQSKPLRTEIGQEGIRPSLCPCQQVGVGAL